MFDINNLKAVEVSLASPDAIRSWSHGEVTEPETINYRTQKPEENGLFCERIFGPSKDYECHCGKYKKIRFKGIICDKCGVEVTSKEVRRERMGHIELASPCTHIWYLKGIPSRIGLVLDVSPKQLEEVAYFAAHICLNEGTDEKKCKFISYKEVLDERSGREVFGLEIKDITDNMVDHETADYVRGIELLDKLNNPAESFDFFVNIHYIEKFRNVEFGEGADAIKRLLKEVNLNKEFDEINKELETANGQKRAKLIKRLEVIQAFRNNENKPEWMVLDVIPVIPPDLRPMLQIDGGRFAASDLNELYRRVITRNNRLKRLIDNHAPYVMQMNEKRMLQEAVDALIDNGRRSKAVQGAGGRPLKSLSSSLKGKQGRFRQNLLGKRVDYSGRSVIAVGPSLKMYQCGIPREMAIQLLRPFIACELIKPVEEGGQGITLKEADKYIDRYDPSVFDVIERIIGMHPVLLNRAPTLHRLGIQAFQPKLVDGRAIRLHPLVCPGFNADFDGDQMAVHVPLSKSAQEEALHLMLASNNILGPKDGKPITIPSQDMVLGNYYLTIEETKEDFEARAKRRHVSSAKLLKSSDNAELREGAVDLEEADQLTLYAECEGKVFRNVNEVLDAYATHQVHLHDRIAIRASSCGKYFGTNYQDYLELEHKDEERHIHVFEKILTEKEFNDIYNGYLITTAGKVIFNQIFPQEFPYINDISEFKGDVHFYNCTRFFVPRGTNIREYIHNQPLIEPVKKKNLGIIINEVFSRYGKSKTSAVLDKIKDQGFKYSTVAGLTVSISDINVVDGKKAILDKGEEKVEQITDFYKEGMITDGERHKMVVEAWKDASDKVAQKVVTEFVKDKRNPLFMMYDSGARGNKSNFAQLLGTRGLMSNPKGEEIELPVKSCFREGMTVSEFFIATHGARKGGADTALKTADSGYLTRRLVDVSQDVIVRERDCHTDHGFVVSDIVSEVEGNKTVIVKLRERLIGRYALHDVVNPKTGEIIVKGTYGVEDIDDSYLIDEDKAKEIVDAGISEVEIRSLFGCETKDGVCEICYGRNVATNDPVEIGQAVGIMAAQSIGEPGTQLTMRTFHTGGVAGSDITQGLPRVQELVEARDPKGKALISIIDGKVTKIAPVDNRFEFTVKNDKEEQTMISDYGAVSVVKKGDMVEAGDQLTKGAISPKELLEVSNTAKVERYLIKEILKVYSAQGIGISDKHIEVIIRQMLRKVYITDSGDTTLLPGTKVSVDDFTAINEKALMEGKQPAIAHPIILGITKAALETDSFLSAASFQETTRVLTDAAIKAKRDDLHGLKENVICGKLIPAGTGVRDAAQENDILSHFDVIETMKGVKKQYIEVHDRPEDIDD